MVAIGQFLSTLWKIKTLKKIHLRVVVLGADEIGEISGIDFL